MIALKWLLIVVAIGYLGGVTVLYFKQRELLFPIPPTGRDLSGSGRFSGS